MNTDHRTSGLPGDANAAPAAEGGDRMDDMRELLADLRASIRTQRHLIDVSRSLLDRS